MMETVFQLIVALQIANITATFGVLFRMGSHSERLKNLERVIFKGENI